MGASTVTIPEGARIVSSPLAPTSVEIPTGARVVSTPTSPELADTWDYVASANGSLAEAMPYPSRQNYEDLLKTVEDPKGFEDQLTSSMFLESVLAVNRRYAYDATDALSRQLFKEKMTPGQVVQRALQNEDMIGRWITSWNSVAAWRRINKEMPSQFEDAVMNQVTKGAANVIGGLVGTAGDIVAGEQYGYTRAPFGAGTIDPSVKRPPEQVALEQRAKDYAKLMWDISNMSELQLKREDTLNKWLAIGSQTLPYIVATTGAALLTGPAGAFGVGYSVEGNSAYQEAIADGVPEEQARMIQMAVGVFSGAVETFGGMGADIIIDAATKSIRNKLVAKGANFTLGTLQEAFEEGIQELGSSAARATYKDVDGREVLMDVLTAAAGGAAVGGPMNLMSRSVRGVGTQGRSVAQDMRELRFAAAQGELTEEMVAQVETFAQEVAPTEKAVAAPTEAPIPAPQAPPAAITPEEGAVGGVGERLKQGRGGKELGKGVYASTSKELATQYARGEGPLGITPEPHEGEVIEFGLSDDAKIFDMSPGVIDEALFSTMMDNEDFKKTWDENWGDPAFGGNEHTTQNIWDAANEARVDIQSVLESLGYQGAKHPNYVTTDQPGGSFDYAIWDKQIITEKGGIPLFRGQKTPSAPTAGVGEKAPVTPAAVVTPEEGAVVPPEAPVAPEPEGQVSRAAERVQEEAIARDLTETLGPLPTYERMSMADQAKRASEEITRDYENAKRMAYGQVDPPAGLRPASIYRAVAVKARNEGDVETLRNLAVVHPAISEELTALGQAIKAADVGIDGDPVRAIRDVAKSREKSVSKRERIRDVPAKKRRMAKEAKASIRKQTNRRQNWNEFVDSIRC